MVGYSKLVESNLYVVEAAMPQVGLPLEPQQEVQVSLTASVISNDILQLSTQK